MAGLTVYQEFYRAECEALLCSDFLKKNEKLYCPECRNNPSPEEIIAVNLCPLCHQNVRRFRGFGRNLFCPNCRKWFIAAQKKAN